MSTILDNEITPLQREHAKLLDDLANATKLYEESRRSGCWATFQIAARESVHIGRLLQLNELQKDHDKR